MGARNVDAVNALEAESVVMLLRSSISESAKWDRFERFVREHSGGALEEECEALRNDEGGRMKDEEEGGGRSPLWSLGRRVRGWFRKGGGMKDE